MEVCDCNYLNVAKLCKVTFKKETCIFVELLVEGFYAVKVPLNLLSVRRHTHVLTYSRRWTIGIIQSGVKRHF